MRFVGSMHSQGRASEYPTSEGELTREQQAAYKIILASHQTWTLTRYHPWALAQDGGCPLVSSTPELSSPLLHPSLAPSLPRALL